MTSEELPRDDHCCIDLRRHVESTCDQHPDRFDCADCLIFYSSSLREYGIIVHDGGASYIGIAYCPWCGARLPASLRDEWCYELEQRGIDPFEGEIPSEYQSSAWWRSREKERWPDGS